MEAGAAEVQVAEAPVAEAEAVEAAVGRIYKPAAVLENILLTKPCIIYNSTRFFLFSIGSDLDYLA